jgi:hypothetical protein
MEMPHEMTTLSQAIEKARKKGYTNDFLMNSEGFMCSNIKEKFKPEDLQITKVYRFEGMSDPDDMSVLYLMESKSGTKGIFVDAYGTYSDSDGKELAAFLQNVKISGKH